VLLSVGSVREGSKHIVMSHTLLGNHRDVDFASQDAGWNVVKKFLILWPLI
jgi:hypothetical protein